jgi:hypothetical protein
VFPTAVSSHYLAAALASRLDDVAPEGFRVVADEGRITVTHDEAVVGGSAAPQILEDDAEPDLETATRATISAVQDAFAEELREPWPATAGAMPDVDARVQNDRLIMWFGSETAPVLALAPFPLAS